MDFIAHALWTYIIFYDTPYVFLAIIFGILPDLITFGPSFSNFILTKKYKKADFKDPEKSLKYLPGYVFELYKITHSLVIFGIVFLFIFLINGSVYWPVFGWLIHIIVDIPLHTKNFFPVNFLYPISNYSVNGIKWGTKRFMIINYSVILIIFLIRIILKNFL